MGNPSESLKNGEISADGDRTEDVLEFDDKRQTPISGEVEIEEELPKVALMGHVREDRQRSQDVIVHKDFEDLDFSDMQLPDDIVKGLTLCRYDKPTPIQLRAIPLGNLNYDLLLQAKSGTGKTGVFTVCILQQIDVTDLAIQAIVVTPCREIAVQIAHVIKSIGAFKTGMKVKEFIGGTSVYQSIRRTSNCHIAVGTPGRLTHMINDYGMNLSKVKVIALDEADKLMDHSFFDDMKQIFKALPKDKQMIATSATYSEVVFQFLEKFMRNACKIQLDLDNPALCAVDQYMIDAKKIIGKRSGAKNGGMEIDAGFDIKFACLKEVLRRVPYKQAIVFSNYQLRAEKIFELLKDLGWDVDLLSASRSQEDRLLAFTALQQGKIKALIATDVASRGLDIEGVDLVVNFDIPKDKDTYVHRVGRTGRFGSAGKALSICYLDVEHKCLSEFQMEVHFTLWVIEDMDKIASLNDNVKSFQHTSRQLKGFQSTKSFIDTLNMDYETYKEIIEPISNLILDEDHCLERNTGLLEPTQNTTILYEEVSDEIIKQEEGIQKRKLPVKIKLEERILETELELEEGFTDDSDVEEEEKALPSENH